jgi:hypothetical protein
MNASMIQIIAGVGALLILIIIIWRRNSKSSK